MVCSYHQGILQKAMHDYKAYNHRRRIELREKANTQEKEKVNSPPSLAWRDGKPHQSRLQDGEQGYRYADLALDHHQR